MPARPTAKGPDTGSEAVPRLRVPRSQLEAELDDRIASGEALLRMPITTEAELSEAQSAYDTWTEYNETLLRRSFDRSEPATRYRGNEIGIVPVFEFDLRVEIASFHQDVKGKLRRLRSQRGQLGLHEEAPDLGSATSPPVPGSRVGGDDVFIVHGHAAGTKETVARFLNRLLSREPIILHEQPDDGRTILEKFEAHATAAAAAVVLLTGDDIGGSLGSAHDDLKPRARQNVVFELGYFLGMLGRSRVIILHEPGVEIPSDLAGFLHVQLDTANAWRTQLARELRSGAHLDINLNALLN